MLAPIAEVIARADRVSCEEIAKKIITAINPSAATKANIKIARDVLIQELDGIVDPTR